jgi:hypothetical protein
VKEGKAKMLEWFLSSTLFHTDGMSTQPITYIALTPQLASVTLDRNGSLLVKAKVDSTTQNVQPLNSGSLGFTPKFPESGVNPKIEVSGSNIIGDLSGAHSLYPSEGLDCWPVIMLLFNLV